MSVGQVNEEQLEQRLGLVEMARSWSPRVISKLENVIRNYQDDDLYRFNPVRYAIQTGMAESEAIALFLHATRAGLFTMEWHLVCTSCGHLVESLRSMGNLHSHYDCDMCFAVRPLAQQLKNLVPFIALYDRLISELFDSHPDSALFNNLPGAGKQLAPRLLTAFGSHRERFSKLA